MAARPAVLAYEYRPYLEQSCLHRAEIALDLLQRHVTVVNGLGAQLIFGDIGNDNITTRQSQGPLFGCRIDRLHYLPPLHLPWYNAIELVARNPLGQRPQTGFRPPARGLAH